MEEQNVAGEQNSTEWQAPPPPEQIVDTREPAQMSEAATLGNIFIEPGKTFEDLRRKPRFIFALVIMSLLVMAYGLAFYQRVGEANFRTFYAQEVDKNAQAQAIPADQKNKMVDFYMIVGSVVRYIIPVLVLISVAVGGLIYWLAMKAMGGTANYLHGVSAWVYSSFPPLVISTVANFIILFIKPVDDIDIASGQRTLLQANPGFFIDGKTSPVLTTLLGTFDLFLIWGWVLAAIGLQKLGKLSSGSAWAIVLILGLVSLTIRVIIALISGNPM